MWAQEWNGSVQCDKGKKGATSGMNRNAERTGTPRKPAEEGKESEKTVGCETS